MSWTVYILECSDGTYYTGITNDLEARLSAHTEGTGAKYTRGRGPFIVSYQEVRKNRSDASKREHEIKLLSREEKRNLIVSGQN